MLTIQMTKKIKIKLLQKNMKQVDLAKQLGISKQYLNAIIMRRYENTKLENKILESLDLKTKE